MIEVLRLSAEVQSLQSQLAFYKEKAENSVSRELYVSAVAEKKSLEAQNEALVTRNEALTKEILDLKEELDTNAKEREAKEEVIAALKKELKEYQEIKATLQAENVDAKTLIEFWQRRNFGASSEAMVKMMDEAAGALPKNKRGLMAEALSFIERHRHAGWIDSVENDTRKETLTKKRRR